MSQELHKIVRSVCCFSKSPDEKTVKRLNEIVDLLKSKSFEVQTKRITTIPADPFKLEQSLKGSTDLVSISSLNLKMAQNYFDSFVNTSSISFTIDLTNDQPNIDHVAFLKKLIKIKPEATFNFAFVFNNALSSPYNPSSAYERDGFAVGLEPTDLAANCHSLSDWFNNMKVVWKELVELFKDDTDFLGIDSSTAPLYTADGSLINFIKRLGMSFKESCLTDTYTKITRFIKTENPKPVGLCGLMLPCLEDFDLASEYESGNFSVGMNLFLSLHSGLGIDTYPVGINESDETILNIIKLTRALSQKYMKPLSIRFVSDGKAKIGDKTDFKNQYLKDVVIKSLTA